MESDTRPRRRRDRREEIPFFGDLTDTEIIDAAVNLIKAVDEVEKPGLLEDMSVLTELVDINGRPLIRLLITFESDGDPHFAGANIWQKGYGTGNVLADPDATLGKEETLPYQLLTKAEGSPVTLLLEATAEEIVIGVEAINSKGVGSGLENMLTQSVTLS